MILLARLRDWAKALRREVIVLWLAVRDPRVPWYAKGLAALVVGYALSPIDLIPDFIPVLGLLDDLLLVPVGIWLVLRLLPNELHAELREQVEHTAWPRPSRLGAVAIVACWMVLAGLVWVWWSG